MLTEIMYITKLTKNNIYNIFIYINIMGLIYNCHIHEQQNNVKYIYHAGVNVLFA